MAQRVPFLVAELGADADPFMLHLYAALDGAQGPGRNPRQPDQRRRSCSPSAGEVSISEADRFAASVLPLIEAI